MEQDSPIISRCGVKYSAAIILWTLLDAFNKRSIQSATEYFFFFFFWQFLCKWCCCRSRLWLTPEVKCQLLVHINKHGGKGKIKQDVLSSLENWQFKCWSLWCCRLGSAGVSFAGDSARGGTRQLPHCLCRDVAPEPPWGFLTWSGRVTPFING